MVSRQRGKLLVLSIFLVCADIPLMQALQNISPRSLLFWHYFRETDTRILVLRQDLLLLSPLFLHPTR